MLAAGLVLPITMPPAVIDEILDKKAALDGRSRLAPMSKIVLFVSVVNHDFDSNTLTH
jgi:hypothetical protein